MLHFVIYAHLSVCQAVADKIQDTLEVNSSGVFKRFIQCPQDSAIPYYILYCIFDNIHITTYDDTYIYIQYFFYRG